MLQVSAESAVTAIVAVLGSALTGVFAVYVTKRMDRKTEDRRRRELLVKRYLYQFQDAIESLWLRLDNVHHHHGRETMSENDLNVTMLYALGRVLAVERIMAFDCIYPEIDLLCPPLRLSLQAARIDGKLHDLNFHHYDRRSLAEYVTAYEGQFTRASTYLEFRGRYERADSSERAWLAPAVKALPALYGQRGEELLNFLKPLSERLAKVTGVLSAIRIKQTEIAVKGVEEVSQ